MAGFSDSDSNASCLLNHVQLIILLRTPWNSLSIKPLLNSMGALCLVGLHEQSEREDSPTMKNGVFNCL